MAFFTQAIKDGTIDSRTVMSENELRNAIVGRILESNAWEIHKRTHKDAQLTTLSDEPTDFESRIVHKNEKINTDPAIQYDSHSKKFVAGCNCGKEKFVFDTKTDTVESNTHIKMKEIGNYRRNDEDDNSTYGGKNPSASYGNSSSNYGSAPRSSYGQGPLVNHNYGNK